jgi:hypothetical protein
MAMIYQPTDKVSADWQISRGDWKFREQRQNGGSARIRLRPFFQDLLQLVDIGIEP